MAVQGTQPYAYYRAITKSDTANFDDGLSDAIYVGGAGIVVAIAQDGTAVQFTAVAGQIIPIAAKRVNSTTTTATLMIALYYASRRHDTTIL